MSLRLADYFSNLTRLGGKAFSRLACSRAGNFGLTFALVAVPLLVGVGVSMDYVRSYNIRVKMQNDLDAALIAAVKKVDSLNEAQIKTAVDAWFRAQSDDNQVSYHLQLDTMVIDKTNKSIQAVATGTIPTSFLGILNIPSIDVSVKTTVAGPATSFINVYLVLDKSASMMLVATSAGQTAMRNVTGNCVFACHEVEGGPYTYNDKSYATNYDLSKGMGLDLRADVSVRAAKKVLDMIDTADPTHSRIKVSLLSVGDTARNVLDPTSSTSDARNALSVDSYKLTSATSETTSRFDASLPKLAELVGTAGSGRSADKPYKLVLLLTDGVQSERPWVMSSDNAKTSPMNPAWCANLKTNQATVGILYTEYLPMTWDSGYSRTLNKTMASSSFTSLWSGVVHTGVKTSTKRVAYIPYALKDCATSSDLFISAANSADIEAGLSSLFSIYLSTVRLTQ